MLLYDLLGMIRQLGPCTWLVTLSAADLKWKDTIRIIAAQQGQTLTGQEIDNLTWEQKFFFWLRSNPVTAARHFDHRIDLFIKHILLCKNINPLGEVTDFKYRIEFQQGWSSNFHGEACSLFSFSTVTCQAYHCIQTNGRISTYSHTRNIQRNP